MDVKKIKKTQKGFSIGEVLLATFILLIGIVALLKMSVGNLKQVSEAKKIVVAAELAQEGIELVRNARELNFGRCYMASRNHTVFSCWKGFRATWGGLDFESYYDYINGGLSLSSNTKLSRNPYGFYVLSSGSDAEFNRVISVKYYHGNFIVRSLVTWSDEVVFDINRCNLSSKCIYMEQELTDWPGKI